MIHIKATDRDLRKFGITFFFVLTAIAALVYFRHHSTWMWWLGGAGIFLLAGFIARPILKPIYIGWMTFAFILGWINTRLILGILFYAVFTPISLICRLFGKDHLNRKIEPALSTYWIKREHHEFEARRYQQLF